MTARTTGRSGLRRVTRFTARHPRVRLALLLSAPAAWLVVAYLGSLLALLLTSLYTTDPFTTEIVRTFSFENFDDLFTRSAYRTLTFRTVGVAVAVTVIDLCIALPVAFFMAKVARRRTRALLAVAILMPLWASYLIKVYAWRAMLDPVGGLLRDFLGRTPGFGVPGAIVVLSYLWLPYMILPIYAGLDRLPDSLLEASGDLGAKAWRTMVAVVLPLLVPAIVAGTIFTFSLSLGDYITVQIVGGKAQLIGNTVYSNFGANNVPFAAALALIPVAIMIVYLTAARRTGAFENL